MDKGQVSMEFLMTYGWAILIVLGIFSALSFTGVIDLSSKMPEKMLFPEPIISLDGAYTDGELLLKMKNNLDAKLIILPSTGVCNITSETEVMPFDEFVLSFDCTNVKRFDDYVTFRYNNTRTNLLHTHKGYVSLYN